MVIGAPAGLPCLRVTVFMQVGYAYISTMSTQGPGITPFTIFIHLKKILIVIFAMLHS